MEREGAVDGVGAGGLARAAFVMDRLLCRFGLPGHAFVPLLSAHACALPGIMSARLIPDRRDRLALPAADIARFTSGNAVVWSIPATADNEVAAAGAMQYAMLARGGVPAAQAASGMTAASLLVFGILLAYASNLVVDQLAAGADPWRVKLGIAAAPAILFAILMYTIPQSPRWLALRGRLDEARADVLPEQHRPGHEDVGRVVAGQVGPDPVGEVLVAAQDPDLEAVARPRLELGGVTLHRGDVGVRVGRADPAAPESRDHRSPPALVPMLPRARMCVTGSAPRTAAARSGARVAANSLIRAAASVKATSALS